MAWPAGLVLAKNKTRPSQNITQTQILPTVALKIHNAMLDHTQCVVGEKIVWNLDSFLGKNKIELQTLRM